MRILSRFLALLASVALLAGAFSIPVYAEQTDTVASTAQYTSIINETEWQVLALTNRERAKYGLDPFTTFSDLQSVCNVREKEVAVSFSHTRPNGQPWHSALKNIGITYSFAGENIAWGFDSASDVVTAWMNSSGHRANILKSAFMHMGVGAAYDDELGYSWVQLFFTAFDEVYTDCRLVLPSDWSFFTPGMSIDQMGIYAVLESNQCGTCYLPIISEYVTGYTAQRSAAQPITIDVLGFHFDVAIGAYVNGLAQVGGEWGYYRDGVFDSTYYGIVQAPSGTWYYVRDGRIAWGFTGIAQAPSGTWYYVREGRIAWSFSGIVQASSGTWYYIQNGRIAWDYTGLVQASNGSWYYIQEGRIGWSYTGLAQAPSGRWLYVRSGRVAWDYTGLVQSPSGSWVYVKNGAVDWSYCATAQAPSGSWVYVQKGVVDWSYCGIVKHTDGYYYCVKNGRVDLVDPSSAEYIGDYTAKTVHSRACASLPDEGNRVCFSSYQAALDSQYSACAECIK